MATRMQQRRGTAAQWTSANPILAAGEIGFETDTGKFKMGNGSSVWSALSYFADASDFDTTAIESTIDSKVAVAVNNLVAGAPAALNTLNELALAIDSDSSFAATVTSALSQKAGLTAFNNHASATTNVHGITDVAELATKSYADSAVTTHKNVTTNIHGIADTTDLVLTADLSGHNSDTTDVHGIPDTTLLATKSYADSAVGTHNSVTTSVHGISDTADLVYVTDLSSHADETTSVHGITNTADLVYTNDSRLSDTRTPTDGTVTTAKIADDAVTTAKILDSNVTTSKIADGSITSDKIENGTIVDTDISATAAISQGKVDGLVDALNSKAPLADPTFTGTVTLPGTTSIGDISSTEVGYLNGVTSGIQTQIDSKLASATAASTYAPIASPTFTGTVTTPLSTAGYVKTDASGVLSSSAAVAQADVTNLTSDLALKAPLASPTFTGTVVLPTTTAGGNIVPSVDNTYDLGSLSAMWKDIYVGPGSLYVNGQKVLQDESGNIVVSADANENISIRTSGSGNVELDATGTGNIQIKSAMVIEAGSNITSSDGNAVVFGNAINTDTISSKTTNTDLSLSANGTGKVYLNDNAEVNGNLVVGGNLTVSGTTTTVNSETINLADNIIDLNSNFISGSPTENAGIKIKRGDSADVQIRWNESADVWEFTNDGTNYSTITPLNSPTFTGTVSGITSTMVGLGNVDNTSDANKPISTATQTALDLKAPLASPTFTGTVTVAASGIAFTDGTQTKEGVPSRTTISQKTDSYTLSSLTERDTLIEMGKATAQTVTIPTNATVAYPVGTSIDILQTGAGQVSVVGASGVTVNCTPSGGTNTAKLRSQWSSATLFKRATDTWVVMGDLTA